MLVAAPLIFSALTAIVCLLVRRFEQVDKRVSLAGACVQLLLGGVLLWQTLEHNVLVTHFGGWQAPFGIVFVVDIFSAIMLTLMGVVAVASLVYAWPQSLRPYFHSLVHLLLLGASGSFLSGDLLNLYVWFEILLMSAAGLLILDGRKEQLAGGAKYLTLHLLGSAFFLSGLVLLHATAGTLNLADLAHVLREGTSSALLPAVTAFLLVCFALRVGMFPLFFWLPASYFAPSIPVTALFAGLLTNVGMYAMIRIFALPWGELGYGFKVLILMLSVMTMVAGVLAAVTRTELRRIFSWHIIGQVGYMTIGVGLGSVGGVAATIFYLVHHTVVKTNLFFITGLMERVAGSSFLKDLGGLRTKAPWLAALFLIPALSLAGIPPFSGFWAQFLILRETYFQRQWFAAVTIIGVGLLTFYSMIQIWQEAFLKKPKQAALNKDFRQELVLLLAPTIVFTFWMVLMGIWAGDIYDVAMRAAEQVMNPDVYIKALLLREN